MEPWTPTAADLPDLLEAVASWQRPGGPVQLHPGDVGWHERFGAEVVAGLLRVWGHGDAVVALGFLDSPGLLRMAVDPDVDADAAARLVADLEDPARGVLPAGPASVEVRAGDALRARLTERGWTPDEPWTPLSLDLADALPEVGLRVEVLSRDHAPDDVVADRVAVQRAAFTSGNPMTVERWHTMAAGPAYDRARCVVGYDEQGAAVAMATVWSAGPGRPGLIEPLGVHRDHRGRGHGTAIVHAAAHALRDLGAATMTVATPSSNVAAVGAYAAAGMRPGAESTDFRRPAAD